MPTFGMAAASQVLQLSQEVNEDGNYLAEQERWTNIGPIVDFVVVDLESQGQGQVVTCSGAYKDGSIRVVRNGIGIGEQARVELPGIKGMWSLRTGDSTYLVLSFISETRILAMQEEEELGEVEVEGFDGMSPTVLCTKLAGGLVQVGTTILPATFRRARSLPLPLSPTPPTSTPAFLLGAYVAPSPRRGRPGQH